MPTNSISVVHKAIDICYHKFIKILLKPKVSSASDFYKRLWLKIFMIRLRSCIGNIVQPAKKTYVQKAWRLFFFKCLNVKRKYIFVPTYC